MTMVAAPLTAGSAASPGLNRPGRRQEDDVNLVADGDAITALTAGLASGGPDAAHAQAGWLIPEGGVDNQVFGTTGQSAWREDQITLASSDDNGTNAVCVTGDATHALTSEGGDASEDGTGRGTPVIAFDTTQITSDKNYSQPQEGDPCHPLAAGAHPPAIAFHATQDPISGNVAPAVSTEHSGSGAIAFAWQQGDDSKHGADGRGRSWVARAGDYTGALSSTRHDAVAGPAYGVRRLTPTECERLQGFPDSWTAHDAQGKPMSDSFRYRALGNSIAVPVVRWIFARLVTHIEEDCKEHA